MGAVFQGSLAVRAMISAMVDEDDYSYVIISFSAMSFLFLGVFQLSYHIGLLTMLAFYIWVTFLEALRTLLAYWSANDLSGVIVFSKKERTDLRKTIELETELSAEIKPSNVYQDLSRQTSIVAMLFVTQFTLIALVVSSLRRAFRASCNNFPLTSRLLYSVC